MSRIMRPIARRLGLPSLVFCWACLCSCATVSEGVVMPFLSEGGWEYADGGQNRTKMFSEWVLEGQTVENWTELVTVETYNKASDLGSVEDWIVKYRYFLDEECPGSTVKVVRQVPDGVIYESDILNCEPHPDEHEHELVRILDGTYNRFMVHYAVRGAMTPERRAEWLEKLTTLSITVFN